MIRELCRKPMTLLVDIDATIELEMLNEVLTFSKKIIDSSPFAKDNVILDELYLASLLNTFLFLR